MVTTAIHGMVQGVEVEGTIWRESAYGFLYVYW